MSRFLIFNEIIFQTVGAETENRPELVVWLASLYNQLTIGCLNRLIITPEAIIILNHLISTPETLSALDHLITTPKTVNVLGHLITTLETLTVLITY